METKEKKPVQKVVKGEVKTKKSLKDKILTTFIAEDRGSIKEYIFEEVVGPLVREGLWAAATGALGMLIFGDAGAAPRKNSGRTNYSKVSTANSGRRDYHKTPKDSDSSDVIFQSRMDAQEVLNFLRDRIEEYDQATVADFKEASDISPTFTDNNYGWTNLDSAYVRQERGGYTVNLPKARYLD